MVVKPGIPRSPFIALATGEAGGDGGRDHRRAWSLAGDKLRALALAAATIAVGAAYAARARIASAMTAAVGFAKGLMVSARGSLLRLAPCLAG